MAKIENYKKNIEKYKERLNEIKETQEALMEKKDEISAERHRVVEAVDTPDEFKNVLTELFLKEKELIDEGQKIVDGEGIDLTNEVSDDLVEIRKQKENVEKFTDSSFDFIREKASEVSGDLTELEKDSTEILDVLYDQLKKLTSRSHR